MQNSHLIGLVGQHSNLYVCEVRPTGCVEIGCHSLPLGQYWDLLRIDDNRLAFSSWTEDYAITLAKFCHDAPLSTEDSHRTSLVCDGQLKGHGTYSWRMAIIPRHHLYHPRVLVSTGQDSSVRLWNVKTYDEVASLRKEDVSRFTACNVEFCESIDNIYTCGRSPPDLICWNVEKCCFVVCRRVHTEQCFGMSQVVPFDSVLKAGILTGSDDRTIGFWPLAELSETVDPALRLTSEKQVRGIWKGLHDNLVFGEGYGQNCYCWDVRKPESVLKSFEIFESPNQSSCVKQVDMEDDLMCSINYGGEVVTWKKHSGKIVRRHCNGSRHYGLRRLWIAPYDGTADDPLATQLLEEEIERVDFISELLSESHAFVRLTVQVIHVCPSGSPLWAFPFLFLHHD